MFVSRKTSAFIRLIPAEAEAGWECPVQCLQPLQGFFAAGIAPDPEGAGVGDFNFDVVAFLQRQPFDDGGGKLCALCKPVEISYLWRPVLRDADDEMVLETAVNGHADRLLTFNERDFLGAIR